MCRPFPTAPSRALAAVLAGVGLLAAGCGAAGDAGGAITVEREDSAGVAVVRSLGPDRPLAWTIREVLRLGGEDDGPEAFFGIHDGGVRADRRGHLFVLDGGNHRVLEFDREGRHVRTLGRKGGGPGEFEFPFGLSLAPDGTVGVFDYSRRGVVRFAADGSPLETLRLQGASRGAVLLAGAGLVAALGDYTMGADSETNRLLYVVGSDSVELGSVRVEGMKPADFGCVRISGMAPLFQAELVFAVAGEDVLVGTRPEYEVEARGLDGRLRSVIRRDLPPVRATAELAAREVGDSMRIGFGGGGGCTIPAEKVVEVRGYGPVVPTVRGLVAASDGGFWVRRGVGRDEATIDVFAADGEYLGTMPEGTPFPAAFRGEDEIVVVERDELDLPYVVVYRIERG